MGKGKQEPTLLSAHHVHIANLVMHFGMKPFPLKSLPRKYGQSSWKKTDPKQREVFTSIQISQGNLNKVPPIASIKQKVISSLEDIASNPKGYIDKNKKTKNAIYVRQMVQRWHTFSLAHRVKLHVYAQQRQWRAWLEFIQLHFLQLMILHGIISQIKKLKATIYVYDTAHKKILEFSF